VCSYLERYTCSAVVPQCVHSAKISIQQVLLQSYAHTPLADCITSILTLRSLYVTLSCIVTALYVSTVLCRHTVLANRC
jgi:hypothetical protein